MTLAPVADTQAARPNALAALPGVSTSVEVVKHVADLEQMAGDWNRLASLFTTPLLQHDWFLTCAETLHEASAFRIVTVRRDGSLVAIAPLVLVSSRAATWLEIAGSSRLHEPTGLLFEDDEALDALVGAILSIGYPVRLDRLVADGPEAAAFGRCRSRRALVLVRRTGSSCFLELGDDWNGFLAGLSAKWRSGFRSKQKKAEALGSVRFEEHRPTLAELPALLEAAFAIEAASWKWRAGSSLLQNDRLRRFFERYAGRAVERQSLRVYFYRIGADAIAMRIAVEFGGRLWFLKTGYDEGWARLSPGMQLTSDIVRRATGEHLEACEFLGADEPWQHAWPVGVRRYCTVVAYPASVRGILGTFDTFLTVAGGRIRRRRRTNHSEPASETSAQRS
jgi:CelD/BcsL family acetyltransferase involved in cellulose biosynthesis